MNVNNNGLTYKQWIDDVDAFVQAKAFGLGYENFADRDTYTAWESNQAPNAFATELLEAEGFFPGDDE